MPPKAWEEIKSFVKNLIGNTADTGGTKTAGTLTAKMNALLTSWTSTRASYIDRLANSTYGLSAIKTAVDNVLSKIGCKALLSRIALLPNSFAKNPIYCLILNFKTLEL